MYEISNGKEPEKAVLIGVDLGAESRFAAEASLSELDLLVYSAGGRVVDKMVQRRRKVHPAFYVGEGFADSIRECADIDGVDLVIFDDELSPVQAKNLERKIEAKVLDRSQLILDIFAQRARTREAKLQVELAQLQYLLPRLTKLWGHLSRIRGGIGLRGPGETQLEVDRRLVRGRITSLQRQLGTIERRRHHHRERRTELLNIALVGYTNAGKTTILNQLSGSEMPAADRLFATLDAATRRVQLDDRHAVLISDTVGFIRKLPHDLVASFRATLEEVVEADLLLHVIDISDANFEEQIEVVNGVLFDLQASDKPRLLVFNKIDRVTEPGISNRMKSNYPDCVFISAVQPKGIDPLREGLLEFSHRQEVIVEFTLPVAESKLLAEIHRLGEVMAKSYNDGSVHVRARLEKRLINQFQKRDGIVSEVIA